MSKFRKTALWIGIVIVVLIVLPFAFMILVFERWPTHDQALLKAINVESRILMAKKFTTTNTYSEDANYVFESGEINVPRRQWPHAIASLSPRFVSVYPGHSVDITTEIFFDGGWGYHIQPGDKKPPEPSGRFEYLGEDVYWWHPY